MHAHRKDTVEVDWSEVADIVKDGSTYLEDPPAIWYETPCKAR